MLTAKQEQSRYAMDDPMINPSFDASRILSWCEQHLHYLARQLEQIEAGMPDRASAVIETKRQMVELRTLLRGMGPANFQARVTD